MSQAVTQPSTYYPGQPVPLYDVGLLVPMP